MRGRLQTAIGMALAASLLAPFLLACGGGGGGSSSGTGASGVVAFAPFAEAAVVFGQPVFIYSEANQGAPAPSASSLACPGLPAVGPLFVPDVENHRVLGFAQTPIINNLDANFVVGQPDFQFALPGLGASAMRLPTAAAVEGGRLFVADSGNHRVLVYAGVPTSKGAAAALALGQPDLLTGVPAAGHAGLRQPTGLSVSGGRVVVSDRANHRVLVWHGVPAASGAPADLVLGQADFEGTLLNRGGAVGRDTLFDPYGVWTDGTRLAVADRGNHRILLWRTFPTTNGQPADVVLGQPDGTTRLPAAGALGLTSPSDVHGRGDQLCVGDAGNHRVLLWYRLPDVDQAPAEGVLGQSDFDHRAPNDADQDGQADGVPSARTLRSKDGVLSVRLDGATLFVGDTGNHRVLLFRGE